MNPENLNNMIENFSIMQIGDVQKIATKIGCKNININCLPKRRQLLNTLREICEEGRLANDNLTPDQRKKLDEYYNKYNNGNKINNIHIHGPAGSGKTYLALDFITKEIKRNSDTKILFVCTKNGFAKFLARWILIRIINTKEEDKSDDETKEDDAMKYNPQYILNCIHFCTENTGYKAHQGVLKQDSDDQPVYLHFDQIQDTDRVDEYNLIVVDEAHHIIHEKNKEWKQICRDFFYKAKKRIILTDPSQDPSNMNNIREKLAEAAAEEEDDVEQTMENIYNIELNDVVRSTQRITLASHLIS
jgi:Cdc6-like AAA superfamily ATPase